MGEIDMRPIESVQAALSLFGQKSDLRKYRSTGSEEMEKEKELDLVFKDLANYKVQLEIKESVNMQALLKLEVYRKTIEELTTQLKNFEADRDKYLEECREAQTRIEKLELENKEILDQHLGTWKAQEQLQCTVGELQATQEEMLNLKAELAAADESKLTVLRQAELMKIAIEMEKEKTEELLKHISELNEAILSSKFAAIEAEKENYVILSGKEAEIEMATVAAMQAQEQLEEVSKRLDMMEDVENQLLAKSLFVDSLQLELKQTKESHSSSARAASDAIDNINRMKLELDVMARVNSERVIYIESMEMQLKRSREDLDNEREKVVNLNNQIELITLETQEIKNRVAKIEAKELEAQVEIAMLKSELHKGRSRIAAAEAAEASSKSIKSGICLAVQQLAVEAEEVKKENRRLKQEANKEEADDETANFLTSTLAYESLIRNNKKANCRNNGSPPENILKLVESGSGCELDTLKKELETANADIRNLRSVTEQALRRAEIAEKAKIEVEDHLRKWKEQKQRRRAALAALREESTHMDKGNPLMYNSMRKTCKPLGKVLNMKF